MIAAGEVVAGVMRREHGRLMAALTRVTGGDLHAAEDALHHAVVAALELWPRAGLPDNPAAWLMRAGRNKAIDAARRATTASRFAVHAEHDVPEPPPDDDLIGDEQLRLICTCCHPALALDARVGLTLRAVCGLTTEEIARCFLLDPRALAQRLVRAQRKILEAGIPYEVPGPAELPARLDAVTRVIYLVFTEGYAATRGDHLVRTDLCVEAIRLAETVAGLIPDDAEAHGLVALLHLQHARRHARVDAHGRLVLLEDQDRSSWDRDAARSGALALRRAMRCPSPGRLVLQAAIAWEHVRAPSASDTDWTEILALYDLLIQVEPTPVVALNRAVAVAMARGPRAGLDALAALDGDPHLERGHLLPSARADLHRRLGEPGDAARWYRIALERVTSGPERMFLEERLVAVEGS